MQSCDEDKPRVMVAFCEEKRRHVPHQWPEIPTVACPGWPITKARKPAQIR